MHSLCVALLFFVSACSAQDISVDISAQDISAQDISAQNIEETVTCCSPPVLQGDVYSSGITFTSRGKKYYFTASTRYYYSEPTDKIAAYTVVTLQGLGNVTLKILNDYNTGQGYTVTNGRCKISRISRSFPKYCVPSSAVYLGSLKIGSASNYLTTRNYRYVKRPSFSTTAYVESMKYGYGSSCYDVALSFITKSSTGALKSSASMIMGNFRTSIPFSSVFNVPSECLTDTSSEGENMVDETAFDFLKYII